MSARFVLAATLAAATLGGCASLPGSGPAAGTLARSDLVDVVHVTVRDASAAQTAAAATQAAAVSGALSSLSASAGDVDTRLAPGDVLDVTLWSFSPWPGAGNPLSIANPGPIPLGQLEVDKDGAVALPYAGLTKVAGGDLRQAQVAIAARYVALRILQKPTAAVRLVASPSREILVTGAVGQPRSIPWTPAGLTLADALTRALGDGNATLAAGDLAATKSMTRVSVLRGDAPPVEMPVGTALRERIQLRPGDRVILRKAPAVQVTMLGGGTRRDGVLAFARQPVLAEALAEANGLDSNTANRNAVFVLRKGEGPRPTLYEFAWNRAEGLVAAQQFPLVDGDLVYVAEAPIVPVQKVIALLFQATLPAQALR